MGRKTITTTEVKTRYNKKVYDFIAFRAPKGWKEQVKNAASKVGMSYAGYIREAVEMHMANENQSVRDGGLIYNPLEENILDSAINQDHA